MPSSDLGQHLGCSWRHISPTGAEKLAPSLPLAGCVGGTQSKPELRSQPRGSLTSLFRLASDLFKVKK